uniref:Transmembrane protein 154-like n=1 Tax=Scleropages formosus TaxID=113540 RepID=A0A8D0CEN5_SCLFO
MCLPADTTFCTDVDVLMQSVTRSDLTTWHISVNVAPRSRSDVRAGRSCDVHHVLCVMAGTSEAVTEAVTISTWSSGTVDPEDSSQDVTQARGDAHETLLGPTESPTEHPEDDQADSLVVMVAIPLVLLVLIALVVTGFFICRRRKASSFRDGREDQFLAGSNEEKVPMPMFEDDVPSVLELEMEDLEKWIVKDSGGAVQDPGKEK